ncbi:DUF4328 domain-containing protein, partial [Tsukamurella sp. 8J]|uniref:DUF4328 domain-containing protein n=1 Tax=Tsukamurella sp. 8J TaxID=3031962 RepID=UPI0023B92834
SARRDTVDPRPVWQVVVGCVAPVVALVTGPVLALELLGAQGDLPDTDRRRLFIRWWWAGWIGLTMLTVGCLAWRFAGGDLQHAADGITFTIVVDLVAAAFLLGTRHLLTRLATPDAAEATDREGTRWVMAT